MVQTPGQKLREIRESKGISLEEISIKTHIRIEYLDAIESGEIDDLPSKAQFHGFLRLYANEMGVEFDQLLINEQSSQGSGFIEDKVEKTDVLEEPEPLESLSVDLSSSIKYSDDNPEGSQDEDIWEASPVEPSIHPDQIQPAHFSDIGDKIRQRRELLSLSLDQIESHLHIRVEYLKAIEAGRFDQLPSPVQAKGMLANYAEFLDLNSDQLLLAYAEGLQEKRLMNQSDRSGRKHRPAKTLSSKRLKLKNFFSLDLLIILILFVAFATFVIWGINRILREDSPATATDIPEVSDILLATGSPTPQMTQSEQVAALTQSTEISDEPETIPLFTALPNTNPINIVIIPRQQAWVQVTADSEIAYIGRLLPGNAYDYSAKEALEILTGNAGALQIYFNEEDIGSIGLIGQVVDLIFTENGLVLPTPTNTPTTTNTPEITPSPSATPSPSITPTKTTFP